MCTLRRRCVGSITFSLARSLSCCVRLVCLGLSLGVENSTSYLCCSCVCVHGHDYKYEYLQRIRVLITAVVCMMYALCVKFLFFVRSLVCVSCFFVSRFSWGGTQMVSQTGLQFRDIESYTRYCFILHCCCTKWLKLSLSFFIFCFVLIITAAAVHQYHPCFGVFRSSVGGLLFGEKNMGNKKSRENQLLGRLCW